jgi:hypothetical protein
MGGALGEERWERQDIFQSDNLNGRALSTVLDAGEG